MFPLVLTTAAAAVELVAWQCEGLAAIVLRTSEVAVHLVALGARPLMSAADHLMGVALPGESSEDLP